MTLIELRRSPSLRVPSLAPFWAVIFFAPAGAWVAVHWGHQIAGLDIKGMVWAFVGAPLVEEAIFRWGLQEGLSQRLPKWRWSSLLANVLASFAFCLSHQVGTPSLIHLHWMIPSLALGFVWATSKRYWPCVVAHSWFNLCLLLATLS